MKRKIRLREKAAFVLFLVSMSAMDSDSRVVAVIIIITTLGILFYAGQAYRETRGKRGEKMGYKVCPYCGANLDPGERCDCRDEVATSQQENVRGGKGLNKHNDIRRDEKEEIYNE